MVMKPATHSFCLGAPLGPIFSGIIDYLSLLEQNCTVRSPYEWSEKRRKTGSQDYSGSAVKPHKFKVGVKKHFSGQCLQA